MKSVKQLLSSKGHTVWSIRPQASMYDAIKLMADKEIGALLVMDASQLVGIVTERDYARKVVLQGKASKQTPVEDIMTTNVLCARPEQTVEECMALMTEKRVRHLPVLEEGSVVGLISMGDLVKAIIEEQQFIIEQLEHYISG